MKIFYTLLLTAYTMTIYGQSDWMSQQVATSLNTVTLYPDSSFLQHSNVSYPAGDLFEVLQVSRLEHEDDAQNQKFRWYEVRTPDGRNGWIFGDGIAVMMQQEHIPDMLQSLHRQKRSFNYGFEDAIMWIASVEGRDNFHEQDYLNPIYNELYLVITNKNKKSVHIGVAGASARGEYQLRQLIFCDATGDETTDIVIEKKYITERIGSTTRSLEVYAFKAGNIGKILALPLDVSHPNGLRVPTLYKSVEVDEQMVRVAHLQFRPVTHALPQVKQVVEMQHKIETLNWNPRTKTYESLYGQTTVRPRGRVTVGNGFLFAQPQPNAQAGKYVAAQTELEVIQQVDNSLGESYYLVQVPNGAKGYLPAREVVLQIGDQGDNILDFHQDKLSTQELNSVQVLVERNSPKSN